MSTITSDKTIVEQEGVGRVASPPGSQASPGAADASPPVGFDPSRKAWPLCGYAPGNYLCTCFHCERQFQGDKRAMECLECAAASARGLIEIYRAEAQALRDWREQRRAALDELIRAASVFWGAGSEQHNLVRDVADAMFRDSDRSGEAIETTKIGSTEGESAGPQGIAQGEGC
jgi:hypothetical protein